MILLLEIKLGNIRGERREGSEGDVLSLQKVNTPFRVPRMRVKN